MQKKNASFKNNSRGKKITVTLSQHDSVQLRCYAQQCKVRPAVALRRLLHEGLLQYAMSNTQLVPKNQLGLFDAVQLNILNNTSETEN